ncbi:hypothetical protein DXT76_13635 [Halobacillus trueperi]|uniref:Uncharacterized protein n=1 Tax=Halobacillus trueperi TaxID=156205 RepID=A0A3D8VNA1_9BACI|nr:hypothetical protein [Halobacillus trueperi]RDY70308.1 hypothetical protein DXT76_13635 [Halobacillus trueperi]
MSQQLRDQLKEYKRKHNIQTPHPKKKTSKKKKKERLSHREVENLMGMNRPTYRRGKGGAMKQR